MTDHGDVGLARSGRREVRSAPSEASHRVIYKQWQILQRRHRGSTSCSRSDISGRRDAALYPFAGGGAAASDAALLDRREPPIFLFSELRCAPIDGARAVRSYRVEPLGRRRERTGRGDTAACSLAPTFPAGEWCSLSLGGGRRRVWRGASRPARAAWVGRRVPFW